MRAALVARDRVDLVDDHRLGRREELAAPLGGEQDVQRLRRCDQDVGRLPQHAAALAGGRVARANGDADLGQVDALGGGALAGSRASGTWRLRSMSFPRAFSGET